MPTHTLGRDLFPWLLLLVLTVLMSRYTNIDLALTQLFYDSTTHSFPLRHDWLLKHILHDDVKSLSTIVWTLLLLRWGWLRLMGENNRTLNYLLLGSLAAITMNALIRNLSPHSCPWALSVFGGTADYFRLLADVPSNAGHGSCFPSGHAGSAFMWWALVYALRDVSRPKTWLAFGGVLLLGALSAYTQIARGAHFLSHVLASAGICGAMAVVTYHAMSKKNLGAVLYRSLKWVYGFSG